MDPQRVLVIGSGGSGKSTLSRRLGTVLEHPVIHLDSLYWKPGWVEPDKTEWAETVRNVIVQDAWILDGNYSGTLAERIEACDTVVFLDISRLVCLWRVLKRVTQYRGSRGRICRAVVRSELISRSCCGSGIIRLKRGARFLRCSSRTAVSRTLYSFVHREMSNDSSATSKRAGARKNRFDQSCENGIVGVSKNCECGCITQNFFARSA